MGKKHIIAYNTAIYQVLYYQNIKIVPKVDFLAKNARVNTHKSVNTF